MEILVECPEVINVIRKRSYHGRQKVRTGGDKMNDGCVRLE